ncbi:hypothetical protein BHE74_00032289 [Ensete ventricosum]|nr:hypothetical protein GW17_00002781 [Ensete ventricosum]RWW60695.1 hypothetical protein BHE74_00032289 [Ensete ventricosum]RZR78527.1 hypothetical protein BHM03_00003890 [Ensete ventricosum]
MLYIKVRPSTGGEETVVGVNKHVIAAIKVVVKGVDQGVKVAIVSSPLPLPTLQNDLSYRPSFLRASSTNSP